MPCFAHHELIYSYSLLNRDRSLVIHVARRRTPSGHLSFSYYPFPSLSFLVFFYFLIFVFIPFVTILLILLSSKHSRRSIFTGPLPLNSSFRLQILSRSFLPSNSTFTISCLSRFLVFPLHLYSLLLYPLFY